MSDRFAGTGRRSAYDAAILATDHTRDDQRAFLEPIQHSVQSLTLDRLISQKPDGAPDSPLAFG